jgi:hypothetical protein
LCSASRQQFGQQLIFRRRRLPQAQIGGLSVTGQHVAVEQIVLAHDADARGKLPGTLGIGDGDRQPGLRQGQHGLLVITPGGFDDDERFFWHRPLFFQPDGQCRKACRFVVDGLVALLAVGKQQAAGKLGLGGIDAKNETKGLGHDKGSKKVSDTPPLPTRPLSLFACRVISKPQSALEYRSASLLARGGEKGFIYSHKIHVFRAGSSSFLPL